MAAIKCKMCGGDLNISGGMTVAECEYCGSKQTIPNQDNEKKLTLFARADRLRRACEFDKAAGVYENIVAEFPEEAEAYWGLALCRYGIEYVDDPATGKKVPTCHRSSFDSILEDTDFEQACENADAIARRVYREEAKVIEDIRRGILEVSGKEDPYDIFICYKETDENGERTIDSVIAQDIYDALTEKGYRVFFSRISLEDKLGTEYEPYIFAALNSATVMLVFGTDFEYFNAVWVKNEWSRFLTLITSGQKKTLIPCYKGVDAYDMPKEFQRLQAQDMGKVGAIQDLLRGIGKIVGSQRSEIQNISDVTIKSPLSDRGMIFVEDGDFAKALEYFERALDQNPRDSQAYLGKVLAMLQIKSVNEIDNFVVNIQTFKDFTRAIQYAESSNKEKLQGVYERTHKKWLISCVCYILKQEGKKKEKQEEIEEIYVSARSAMDAQDYQTAMKKFACIKGYRDVGTKQIECGRKRAALASRLISAGDNYTVALKSNGTVVTTLDTEDTEDACKMKKWMCIVAISTGKKHVIGLKSDGTVVAMGENNNGQCNVKNWTDIVAISTGESHTVGLKSDGTVVATHTDLYMGHWTDIVAVSAGDGCTMALKSDGTVVTAGWLDAKDWTDIVAVSAGKSHAVGLKSDGTVVAVGSNKNNGCGVRDWTNIVAVSAGKDLTVGLKVDGTVIATNYSYLNILRSWTDIVAVSTSACADHIVGLKSDGIVVARCPKFSDNGCNAQGWKLFNNLSTLEQERDEANRRCQEEEYRLREGERLRQEERLRQAEEFRRQQEFKRTLQKSALESERIELRTELASLRGLFTGKRRREIEARLAEIEEGLKNL